MCFPSFHVIWAVLSARALWGFRYLPVPVTMLAALISISTMTTGWHYFADVLGGLMIAWISILAAKAYLLGIPSKRTSVRWAEACTARPVVSRDRIRSATQ